MKKYNKLELQQFIHRLIDGIHSYEFKIKEEDVHQMFTHISDEQFEITDDAEMTFVLAEYNLLKLHTIQYVYGKDHYEIIKQQNNPNIYFGTVRELKGKISEYYSRLERHFELSSDGDLLQRRKELMQKVYNLDLDKCLFEDIENSTNILRGYNDTILKNYYESQDMLLKMHDNKKPDFNKMMEIQQKDRERYQLIDEKVSPLIYESYEKVESYSGLPHYIIRSHALLSYRDLNKEKDILLELDHVFGKLYTMLRFAGTKNQSSFFGEEDIPQHLAQKHFDFFTVKYDYDVFPYPATEEGLLEMLAVLLEMLAVLEEEKKPSENAISLKTYLDFKDKGVLNREHLFHHDEDKEHIFSNYDKGVSYHKIIEIPGLAMNAIIPLDKEELCDEFSNRKNYTRHIFTEAYTNEYLYLHGKLSVLIDKLIAIDINNAKEPKYISIITLHKLLTKGGKAYRGHEVSFHYHKIFENLMEFLEKYPYMEALYGGLYFLMQKMSLDELQDIFPRELTDTQKEIYTKWQQNMVDCITEFEDAEYPDFLAYFGVKNHPKETFDYMKQKMEELNENDKEGYNYQFINKNIVTGEVIINPDDYDHGYKNFFDLNLKDNFVRANSELQKSDSLASPNKKNLLYKLLYHALWDTLSRETPKNIKSIRWYELLKKQNATDRWQGIFAPFKYKCLDHLLNMIAKGYGFKKDGNIFHEQSLINIPQHLFVRTLYYMSRYHSQSKESMVSFVNMIRESQYERCPIKGNKKNIPKLQKIDFGFEIQDFDVQLYPFSTQIVHDKMFNSEDNKIITNKIIKLFCEGDINTNGDYDYKKALKTRYLFNDRNIFTHDALSKHVKELLSPVRWKELLTTLDEFRLDILLPSIQEQLTYASRIGRVRSHSGHNPNIVFLLHVDRIIKVLMEQVTKTLNDQLKSEIDVKFPKSTLAESYVEDFIKQVEPYFNSYKENKENQYKQKFIDKWVKKGVSKEHAQIFYKEVHEKNKKQLLYQNMNQYSEDIKCELEMLLNVILSTHTSNEYGNDKNTTNYDIWVQYRPQILLYFIAVLQGLNE